MAFDVLGLSVREQLATVYVAYFGRAPDPAGLAYWEDVYGNAVAGGASPRQVLQDISEWFRVSEESAALYPVLAEPTAVSVTAVQELLHDIYGNLFNREPDPAGLSFWTGQFMARLEAGAPVGDFIIEIIGGAQTTFWGDDIGTIANKIEAGEAYVEAFLDVGAAWNVRDNIDDARATVADVTDDPASLQAAIEFAQGVAESLVTESGVVTDGFVAGATVFADLNDNGVFDVGEPTTTTDDLGNFDFGQPVGGVIIASGGTDVVTGLPFEGVLRAPDGARVVSPLTTLVVQAQDSGGLSPDAAQSLIKQALGLPSTLDLATFDPIAVISDPNASDEEKALAVQVQADVSKLVNIASLAAAAGSGATGADDGDIFTMVLAQIGDSLLSGQPIDLSDPTTIQGIVSNALAATPGGDALDPALVDNIVQNVTSIAVSANASVDKAAAGDDPAASIIKISQAQTVAQGAAADAIKEGAAAGDVGSAGDAFSGENFQNAADDVEVEVPGVPPPDDGGEEEPPPDDGGEEEPPPLPAFAAIVDDAGVLVLGGVATGPVTITAISGQGDGSSVVPEGGSITITL